MGESDTKQTQLSGVQSEAQGKQNLRACRAQVSPESTNVTSPPNLFCCQHPIKQWIARYIGHSPQEIYEKKMYLLQVEYEKAQLR